MKKIKFVISPCFSTGCNHEIIEEVEDDVTEQELEEIAEQLVWERISVSYEEISE